MSFRLFSPSGKFKRFRIKELNNERFIAVDEKHPSYKSSAEIRFVVRELKKLNESSEPKHVVKSKVLALKARLDGESQASQSNTELAEAYFRDVMSKRKIIRAKEIENGEKLEPGTIYVAPGNFHARLKRVEQDVFFTLDQGPHINSVRPAVDPLFETAAEIYGSKLLAVVLTGMGADGKAGAVAVKKNRGAVVIQDKKSSVVFGMPGAIFDVGAFDFIGDLTEISDIIGPKINRAAFKRQAGD